MSYRSEVELASKGESQVQVIEVASERDQASGISQLWRIILKRRNLVVGVMVGAIALVLAVSLILPKKYDGITRLVLDFSLNDVSALIQSVVASTSDLPTKMETQIRILESDTLAEAVIKNLKLHEDAGFAKDAVEPPNTNFDTLSDKKKIILVGIFANALSVEVIRGTQIIEIRFRNHNPALAANAANMLAKVYTEQNFQTKYNVTIQAADWLNSQLNDIRQHAEEAQMHLAEYQKKTGIVGTDETNNIVMAKLTDVNKQLTLAEADRIAKEARYRIINAGDPEMVASVAGDNVLNSLRVQESQLKAQRAQLSEKYGPNYPQILALNLQISDLDKSITSQLGRLKDRANQEFRASTGTEKMLQAALEQHKQDAFKMYGNAMQYATLLRDVQASRDLYEDLTKKLKEAGVLAGLRSTNVTVVDRAHVPFIPAQPRILLNFAISLLGGVFLGIAAALTAENVDTSITSPDDVAPSLGLPNLGIIPRFRWPALPDGVAPERLPFALINPKSEFSEALRALRTSLLLSSAGSPPKVILFTSGLPSEGKTTVSLNSAVVLAQAGRSVLIVDADMRRPSVHKALMMGRQRVGLSGCLTGAENWRDGITTHEALPGLSILSAGVLPPFPSELLSSDVMRKLVEEWKQEFDHVIIDSPPVLAVTDATVLARLADIVVLVVRAQTTRKQSLRRATEVLRDVSAKIAGFVINDLSPESVGYRNYYGYYGNKQYRYYYGSSEEDESTVE
jgi:capsular exopolysaccharide synthesis family protein